MKANTWKQFVLEILYLYDHGVFNGYKESANLLQFCTPEFKKKVLRAFINKDK